jgi:threonine dehydrogenase-like Zn-dependent dehydrogenase
MFVGEIVEAGDQVSEFSVGDIVYGRGAVRQTHDVSADHVTLLPDGVDWQTIFYSDPAHSAMSGVRDSRIRIGDRVTVHGLGAIGQMVVQMCKLAGARWVVGIDPIVRRRDAAARLGADLVMDPHAVDVGYEIKTMTDKLGVDAAIEVSSSSDGFYDALRSVKYQGRIASIAYYKGPMDKLLFSGEWHRNRIEIVSSRSDSEPNPDFGWGVARIREEVTQLLVDGRLRADGLIDPIVPFSQAGEAYMQMNERPETGIKLGIDHTLEW